MSVTDLWEPTPFPKVPDEPPWETSAKQAAEILERLERIERMLGAGSVRTVTETQRRTRQAVAQAIEDGCHTRRTIAGHGRIAMQRVSDALLVLEAEGRVTKELRPTGGKGRPMHWYELVYAEPLERI